MRPDSLHQYARRRRATQRARIRLLLAPLLLLMILPLHSAFAQGTEAAPWRAVYQGMLGSETVWLDVKVAAMPDDSTSRSDGADGPLDQVEAKILLPDHRTVLFGEGQGSDDGGLHLVLRDDTGGRGAPGSRGAPGTAVGKLDGLRSMGSNDDGRTLEGSIDLSGSSRTLAAHRVAQYAYLSYELGPVSASMALPDFHGGPWQAIDEPLWQEEADDLRSFASEGRADYIDAMVWHGWTSESDTTVQGISSDHLSLLTARYSYTGGAHGNTTYVARTYEATPAGPRLVDLAALLLADAGARSALVAYVLDQLRAQDATWVVQDEVLTLSNDDLALFSLTPQGLQFVFPPYAMGSYAEGTYTVLVPYDVARAWVPADGLIARLARPGAS